MGNPKISSLVPAAARPCQRRPDKCYCRHDILEGSDAAAAAAQMDGDGLAWAENLLAIAQAGDVQNSGHGLGAEGQGTKDGDVGDNEAGAISREEHTNLQPPPPANPKLRLDLLKHVDPRDPRVSFHAHWLARHASCRA